MEESMVKMRCWTAVCSHVDQKIRKWIYLISLVVLVQPGLNAWELHALISHPVFASMPLVMEQDSVSVTSLEAFLMAVEADLEEALGREERWAQQNLAYYPPLPAELLFKAGGEPEDLRQRFIQAIRIHPEARLIPYLQRLPGQGAAPFERLAPEAITPLKHTEWLSNVTLVGLPAGTKISPLDVLVTATDEPDMGLDVGLYADNDTEAGRRYGMGQQPFGNPNLEYGSQGPLHMGLYHEAALVNTLAPFISECLPEYRIHLFKTLAELAFEQGQDYWGWRFMGWGLHYIADLAQPYHAKALPGVSVTRMLLMNALNMMGAGSMQEHAIQLISNRHTAIEALERQWLEEAYQENIMDHMHIETLGKEPLVLPYKDELIRTDLTQISFDQADLLDRNIERSFPAALVSDPEFELSGSEQQADLLNILRREANPDGLLALETQVNDLLELWSIFGRSYVTSILSKD
jgi:hypothetical protein